MNRRDFLKALASLPALAALAHVPQVVLPAEAQNIDGAVAASAPAQGEPYYTVTRLWGDIKQARGQPRPRRA
jgi:hypothetical protein